MEKQTLSHPGGQGQNQQWCQVKKMLIYLCGFPLKKPSPQSNHEKYIRQILTERQPDKYSWKLSKSSKTRNARETITAIGT